MGKDGKNLYKDAKRSHYEELVPLIKQARDSLEEAMDSEDEKIKYRASKFVLEKADDWLKGTRVAGNNGLENIGAFEREPDEVDPSVTEELT